MFKIAVLLCLVAFASAGLIKRPLPDGRIVGGAPIEIEQAPWQVSMQYFSSHRCGGSIINSNTVLTAAHCVTGISASSLSFRAGSSMKNSGGTLHQASSIIVHPNYSSSTFDYDYAIVKVETNFEMGSGVSTVPLQQEEVAIGATSIVTGWGATSEGGSSPNQLQSVDVPIVSDEVCNTAYGGSITERMICAGLTEGGKDSCQGDSGGPLTVDGVLTGIVSWGRGCARPDFPGVYSKVQSVVSWINENS